MAKTKPSFILGPIVIDCAQGYAGILAKFYSRLLDWTISHPAQNGTAAITSEAGNIIAFQEVPDYEPPVWPWQKGKHGQMLHLTCR